jgi:hypothetical protein
MTSTPRRAFLGTLLLALSGCVGPVEIAPLPYAHPANPDAPAGTLPPLGSALEPTSAAAATGAMGGSGAHQAAEHGKPAGTPAEEAGEFQCPMHPEVRSGKPGRCHICGMSLVKQSGHEGHHEH